MTFTPTDTAAYATATRTVQLVINPAPDFTITAKPATLTIAAGASGPAILTITLVGGFNDALQLTCSGLPANSTCTFSPTTVTPAGAPVTATLTIATDVQTASLATPSPSVRTALLIPPGGFVGGLIALCFLPRKKMRAGWRTFCGAILVVAALGAGISAMGCGSSMSTGGGTSRIAQGESGTVTVTPAGSSTIVVTASTASPGGRSHSAALTLNVTS
ncbi:MAG: hypothetical protein WA426_19240 [Silvibacterium sp.]